jgi:HEAT repeat protein
MAMAALWEWFRRRKLQRLVGQLESAEAEEREAAARQLVAMGAEALPAVVEALREGSERARLRDEEVVVRAAAAEALGKLGDPTAVVALAERLRDESRVVANAAETALDRIGTPAALEAIRKWREEHRGA